MLTIDNISYKCMLELNNLKYCYESTISDCIESVAHKYDLNLTQDDKRYLKRKLIAAMIWKDATEERLSFKED